MNRYANRILSKVADLNRVYGTCTDVSVFAGIPDAEKASLPIFSDDEIGVLRTCIERKFLETVCGLPVARDGRKILAFVTACRNAHGVGFQREMQRVDDEMEWATTRFALRYVITDGAEPAKLKMYEFASECIADHDTDKNETVKAVARAYNTAKNRTSECLERLWLELFETHGVSGAVDWFRANWKPVDDETRDAVNAAYKNAKRKNERDASAVPAQTPKRA